MKLSKHFTLQQLTTSATAVAREIDNTPPPAAIKNLRRLADGLEQIRRLLGVEIELTSAYRAAALNRVVGGAEHSQHVNGEAADFTAPDFGSPFEICRALVKSSIEFDQLIYEFGNKPSGGWVHVSFCIAPRRRVLTIFAGEREYREGLHARPGGSLVATKSL